MNRELYLSEGEIDAVIDAAVDLGWVTDAAYQSLLAGVPPAYWGTIPVGGQSGVGKLVTVLSAMNSVVRLATGDVPLELWLNNARRQSRGQEQNAVFVRMLEKVRGGGDASLPDPTPVSADQLPDSVDEANVTGLDGSLSAVFLTEGARVAASIARIAVPRHFGGQPKLEFGDPELADGTGWLIGSRLLVTNRHVIAARMAKEPDASEGDLTLQALGATVTFDDLGGGSTPIETSVAELVAVNAALDVAVLRLADDAPDRPALGLRAAALHKAPGTPFDERVNVLSHPGGRPMRLAFRNNFVVRADAETVSYLTETEGGSSGAPVCDDNWEVAALHRGFRLLPDASLSLRGKPINAENYGTPIAAIVAWLQAEHAGLGI